MSRRLVAVGLLAGAAVWALAGLAVPARALADRDDDGTPAAPVTPTSDDTATPKTDQPVAAPADSPGASEAELTPDVVGEQSLPSFWEGGGVVVGEGMIAHPSVEISGSYQPNVFYQAVGDPGGIIGAPIIRVGVGSSVETVTPGRMEIEAPGGDRATQKLAFHADGSVTWNQYVSSDQNVSNQSGVGLGLLLDLKIDPEGALSAEIRDAYVRSVNPGESLVEDLDRDRNELDIAGSWRPGGGAIQIYSSYQMIVDLFESGVLDYHDRLLHNFQLGGRWAWLPRTIFEIEGDFGITQPDDPSTHPSSTPLRLWGGVNTLLGPTFGIVARGGWGFGFYANGGSFSGYLAQVELRWAPAPTLRAAIGYSHDFADALIGNDYADHTFYARAGIQLAGRWQLKARAEVRLRSYDGIADQPGLILCGDQSCGKFRNDFIAHVEASAEYQVTKWLYGGVYYTLENDSTDFYVPTSTGGQDNGSYLWSELMAKVSARW